MKNSFKILFVGWYLFLSVGFSIATHYCGNVIGDIKIVSVVDQSPPDSCCETEGNPSCCDTDFDSYKLKDLHQSAISHLSHFFDNDLSTSFNFFQLSQNETSNFNAEMNQSDSNTNSYIYKTNCAFII